MSVSLPKCNPLFYYHSLKHCFLLGLLAKNAVENGLGVKPYIKTSLSPGSGVVTYYLNESGVTPFMEKLGYVHIVKYVFSASHVCH